MGVSLIEVPGAGCCGAVRFHLNRQDDGRDDMRALVDAWWPYVERGEVEAIVVTASGCGATVKEYGHLLEHDPVYRDKAARISAMAKDLSEVVQPVAGTGRGRVAFQSPCSLQHGQQIRGKVESLLEQAGYELTPVPDAHLCCGSAGTGVSAVCAIAQPQACGAAGRRTRHDRHRQHRLPDAPRGRRRGPGTALDRAPRPGLA
jgi:glycolate oxidase iron-sulfur subunit